MAASSEPRRILISYWGTRGDVQPYVVAGRALREAGYNVLLCGPGDGAKMAEEFNMPFRRVRLSMNKAFDDDLAEAVSKNTAVKPPHGSTDAKEILEEKTAAYKMLLEFQPELMLVAPLQFIEFAAWSRVLLDDVPIVMFCLQRVRPCHEQNVAMLEKLPKCMNMTVNRLVVRMWFYFWGAEVKYIKQVLPEEQAVNFRMCTTQEVMDHYSYRPNFPTVVSDSSAILGDIPSTWDKEKIVMPGPMLLSIESQSGEEFGKDKMAEMEQFLAKGSPPIYIGFGSMKVFTPKQLTLLCVRALKLSGQRGVICSGWAGMAYEEIDGESDSAELMQYCQESVLFMAKSPHGLLFPRCGAAIHHGGAGTMNASVRSGKPTIIVPCVFDQFMHAERVNQLGIGVGMKHISKETPTSIAAAITKCVESETIRAKAEEVGAAFRQEEQEAKPKLVQFVHDYFRDYVDGGLYKDMVRELREKRERKCCFSCCSKKA